ncbi:MAG: VPDSG-CTERM sorting domain-containing protein [Verrucomicrobiota bacterium]
MKKLWMTGLMGMALAIQCSALTVSVSRVTGYWEGAGGEFNIANAGNPTDPAFLAELSHFNSNPSTATIVTGPNGLGFETFCNSGFVELQNNPQNGTFTPNNVAWGAAWLYNEFATGGLAAYGYDYSTTGSGGTSFANRAAAAYALQNAIWELDGTGGSYLNPTAAGINLFLTAAANAGMAMYGTSFSDTSAANGAFDVYELYLTYNGVPSQPMLGFGVPVPDGGSTIILLGMALTGIGLFSRRFVRG